MKILFTICGRAGSKGIENKNSKKFLDSPLPFYTVSVINLFVKENPDIEYDIVLNTDSEYLSKIFKDNLDVDIQFIERDANLGLDNTPKIAVISSSYEIMKERNSTSYDMIVDLDLTAPLRTVKDINNLVKQKMNSDADVVFSVTDSRRNPYFNMVKETSSGYVRVIESEFNVRQEAPNIYDMNASLYAYSPEFLKSGKNIFDGKCDIIKMSDTAVLDLDYQSDFHLMEVIAKYLFENDSQYRAISENINSILK